MLKFEHNATMIPHYKLVKCSVIIFIIAAVHFDQVPMFGAVACKGFWFHDCICRPYRYG